VQSVTVGSICRTGVVEDGMFRNRFKVSYCLLDEYDGKSQEFHRTVSGFHGISNLIEKLKTAEDCIYLYDLKTRVRVTIWGDNNVNLVLEISDASVARNYRRDMTKSEILDVSNDMLASFISKPMSHGFGSSEF